MKEDRTDLFWHVLFGLLMLITLFAIVYMVAIST